MRLPVNRNLPLAALTMLLALGAPVSARDRAPPPVPVNGPQADYPMVLGAPFEVDGVTYTPADTMNYDAVGYAAGTVAGSGISGSHRTLPLPSYVEVTSLDTGRTILVRLERRGPMTGSLLIELSPAAAAQLGIVGAPRAPVRVRRVNPPEPERGALRAGQSAPLRMDTPPSLLTVLKRRLEQQGAGTQVSRPGPMPMPDKLPVLPPKSAVQPAVAPAVMPPKAAVQPAVAAKPEPVQPRPFARPAAPAVKAAWTVQLGAFGDRARADGLARRAGGRVEPAGAVWRVRVGGYATRGEADAALAKLRAAGYSEASVQRAN
ncbi:SPOR domain-containing protein [Novosphingobium sp.]|uniref:septal ring lytic transglycosylase RlpA family protein n=1 Tax=Novosphingobium sp. TaxID=1874826 RepID=UPI0022C59C9D|nr:SPOR domain-containing protein [Novosphingobium sp.]MCZ8017334.1 SPOR domain-containing protein [Novosphingobium sp.]MCZ8034143.1 SPOR domain-containing protein [Novosphingobium sp.]MCZ8051498.1 SPOR domain-containing protein [Novosphingobium sp.]MCZ8059844.1 SPOR domain-containing protein [Novosphingobium sp.]MCZ8231682.1 SPOR domain-containing protein [Novosphingobium sp.]